VLSASDVRMAVHGTNVKAWEAICANYFIHIHLICLSTSSAKEGLSKMKRNHIHLAQGVPGDKVISGKLLLPP